MMNVVIKTLLCKEERSGPSEEQCFCVIAANESVSKPASSCEKSNQVK